MATDHRELEKELDPLSHLPLTLKEENPTCSINYIKSSQWAHGL